MYFDEADLIRSITKESFYEFVREFWTTIISDPPVWNWHIKYLCDELQIVAERVFQRKPKLYDLVINISPGSTKSTICSVTFPAWVWTRMPEARIIGASYSHPIAMDLSRKNRDIILSDKYQYCFSQNWNIKKGNWESLIKLREDQSAKSYFMNTRGGSRYSTGVGGSVTGMHGHFLIVDDPLNPNEAASEADLLTANRWMAETLPTRKVDAKIVPTILIMQRLHQDDPSHIMVERGLKDDSVKHICLPAELEDNISPKELRRFYVRGLMDPIRLSKEVLERNRLNLGEYAYSGQYRQDPIPRGGLMFDASKLHIEPRPKMLKRLVRYWDKAGSEGQGAYTVGLLMGEDYNERCWILDIVRGQWNTFKREEIIKMTAAKDSPQVPIVIEQEPGSGGKESAEYTIRRLAGFRVRADRPTGDKVARAVPYSSQVNGGNVYLIPAIWNSEYINELQYFPKSKYKDQIDASSGAFNELFGKNIRAGAI